jgi:predicted acyltransferase
MFMVGVALPYSYAARKAKGQSEGWIAFHTVLRAAILVGLGVFLSSNGQSRTHFTFVNVLSQIGLGYVFVYLLRGRGLAIQCAALGVILVGYTALFAFYPAKNDDFDWKSVGVKEDGEKLNGYFRHWAKNANPAHDFDVWFLNLFPQPTPPSDSKKDVEAWEKRGYRRVENGTWRFAYNAGGYQTLNFVPSLATMILGLMAGELLRRGLSRQWKFLLLVAAGTACLLLGWLAGEFICPSVKRIWTPSWALYSSGWVFLILAAFFGVIDVVGFKSWTFPLIVVGMNSIAIYCMSQLMRGFVNSTLKTHLPTEWFAAPYGAIVSTSLILLVFWLTCVWMYRRGIFLRI